MSIVPAEDGGGSDADGKAFRLTTPAGYTVDGLDAQTLAFVLRVVG